MLVNNATPTDRREPHGLAGLPTMDQWPYRLSGTVYGVLLNKCAALAALGETVNAPPYNKPPEAPVLFIKPRNTLATHGATVWLPVNASEIQINATLGVVIGQSASRVTYERAMDHVAGYTIVADLVIPHANLHRPSLRFNARDGFCPIGPCIVERAHIEDPNALTLEISIDAATPFTSTTGDMVRNVARLIVDISEFMTLAPGDIVTIGAPANAPRVHAGQTATIRIAPIGTLAMTFASEQAQP